MKKNMGKQSRNCKVATNSSYINFILLFYAEIYSNRGKGKKGSQHSVVKHLMEKTKIRRHQWIPEERPLVSEVVEKFPHLTSSRWVS